MNVLDLFSGIGGFSLGLERAGMKTVAFCEIDKSCQNILKKHWPNTPIFSDVKKLNKKTLGKVLFHSGSSRKIDVICGGFPCQDISVAGKKKGLKGERSGLWKEFKRLIKEIEPRYAIIENVANLRSSGLAQVIKDLWQIGYACEWHIISARSVGAPHLRERIWIIAYPDSSNIWKQPRGSIGESWKKKIQLGISGKNGEITDTGFNPTNTNNFRFWKPFATEKEKSEWWTKAASCFSDRREIESPICGVDDGLSPGLDKARRERIKQLGNAVVPQIPEIIGKELINYEKRNGFYYEV